MVASGKACKSLLNLSVLVFNIWLIFSFISSVLSAFAIAASFNLLTILKLTITSIINKIAKIIVIMLNNNVGISFKFSIKKGLNLYINMSILLKDRKYYEYGDNKTESACREYWDKIKK